jgi:hypothetical protein
MSLELVNTFATLGTFSVIAATAIAAIVQLRHMRGSNQIVALNELRETTETAEFRAAQLFVQTELSSKLRDPAFRYQVANAAARTEENKSLIAKAMMIGNFYEGMGVLVKNGLVEAELAIAMWWWLATNFWEILSPFTAIARRVRGATGWENFEYLTVLSQDWAAAHPEGSYPARKRRLVVKDEWREADRQYEASLARA